MTAEESTTPKSRTEKVYVLFGSQTGNSEEAALAFAKELPTKLSPEKLQQLTGTPEHITLVAKSMQLDDFLELQKCDWTRLLVIFVSSYGIGQAPLGSYRFRDVCDAWKENSTQDVLGGVQFALCGLGDSSYTTFFQNPTTIAEAMQQVGATLIGTIGKADASQTGNDSQANVIQRWKDSIWQPLAKAAVQEPVSAEVLKAMQDKTIELCCKINPDFVPPPSSASSSSGGALKISKGANPALDMYLYLTVVPVIMVILGVVAIYFLK